MVLITCDPKWQNQNYVLPANVIIIDRYETQFQNLIEKKILKQAQ